MSVRFGLLCVIMCACDLESADSWRASSWSIESKPRDGEQGVARARPLRVQLDRRVLPRSVSRANVRLRSGAYAPPIELRYELLTREIVLAFDAAAPLRANTTYGLEVEGLIDLDGFEQPEPWSVLFRTGDALDDDPLPQPADAPGAALALLSERCASAGCHTAASPAAALDLSSALGVERTALRTSGQLELGSLGEQGASGVLWVPATRIVDVVAGVGQPASSYLMYKVIGDDHIVGDPMPPTGPRLRMEDLELLVGWIRRGAPTRE
jgi:Bacterial Ig-like domain